MIIPFAVACLLFLFGVLIKHFKCYWLISGYNTASLEHKLQVDVEGLGRFMGDSCFVLAALLLIQAGLMYRKYAFGSLIILVIMPLYIIYMLIRAQSFDPTTRTADGRMKTHVKVILGSIIAVFCLVAAGLGYGSLPQEVVVTSEYVQIRGIYGMKIGIEEIRSVILEDSIPRVIRKTNGFNMGNILKGYFRVEDLGDVKLFVHMGRPPYIYIYADDMLVIINYKDVARTKELYDSIKASDQPDG
jgi:hypothetical protein